jgi:hypothetical protein
MTRASCGPGLRWNGGWQAIYNYLICLFIPLVLASRVPLLKKERDGSMLEVLNTLLLLLAMLTPAAALGWVYWRTRRPAALVYLFWHLLGPSLLGAVTRWLLDSFQHHSGDSLAFRELLLLPSLLAKGLGAGLFIWLLFSMMQWARPEAVWLGRSSRPTPPAVPKTRRRAPS